VRYCCWPPQLLDAQNRADPAARSELQLRPYNTTFLAGGVGLSNPLAGDSPVLQGRRPMVDQRLAAAPAHSRCADDRGCYRRIPGPDVCRCLILDHGQLLLQLALTCRCRAATALAPGHMARNRGLLMTATTARLYVDGSQTATRDAATGSAAPVFRLAPERPGDLTGEHHFRRLAASFLLHATALDATAIGQLNAQRPDFNWSISTRSASAGRGRKKAWARTFGAQPAWTLPHRQCTVLDSGALAIAALTDALQPAVANAGGSGRGIWLSLRPSTLRRREYPARIFPRINWYIAGSARHRADHTGLRTACIRIRTNGSQQSRHSRVA